jgi:hypothetical protein
MKRGDKFLHAHYINEDKTPLVCEVTRVANGLVYWKQEGERKARHYFELAKASQYVKQ